VCIPLRTYFYVVTVACSPKDVKDVGYVIVCRHLSLWTHILMAQPYQNYDFPNNCEDYIHRIGRTGVCFSGLLFNAILTLSYAACWHERHFVYIFYD
jgi:hypothetical protein